MHINHFYRNLLAVAGSGFAYWIVGEFQMLLPAEFASGVSAPYLPAGVRLIAAVVCGLYGCLGVFLASLVLAPQTFPDAAMPVLLAIAGASAFVPLVALAAVRRAFGIGDQLTELSFRLVLLLVVLQSVLSPIAHQLLYHLTGLAPAGALHLLVMISGDLVGTMLVLLVVAAAWGWLRRS